MSSERERFQAIRRTDGEELCEGVTWLTLNNYPETIANVTDMVASELDEDSQPVELEVVWMWVRPVQRFLVAARRSPEERHDEQ